MGQKQRSERTEEAAAWKREEGLGLGGEPVAAQGLQKDPACRALISEPGTPELQNSAVPMWLSRWVQQPRAEEAAWCITGGKGSLLTHQLRGSSSKQGSLGRRTWSHTPHRAPSKGLCWGGAGLDHSPS